MTNGVKRSRPQLNYERPSDTIDFTAFSQAYREELAQQADEGARLATLARRQTVTLLFAAKNTEQNHALVLADWLRHL